MLRLVRWVLFQRGTERARLSSGWVHRAPGERAVRGSVRIRPMGVWLGSSICRVFHAEGLIDTRVVAVRVFTHWLPKPSFCSAL